MMARITHTCNALCVCVYKGRGKKHRKRCGLCDSLVFLSNRMYHICVLTHSHMRNRYDVCHLHWLSPFPLAIICVHVWFYIPQQITYSISQHHWLRLLPHMHTNTQCTNILLLFYTVRPVYLCMCVMIHNIR